MNGKNRRTKGCFSRGQPRGSAYLRKPVLRPQAHAITSLPDKSAPLYVLPTFNRALIDHLLVGQLRLVNYFETFPFLSIVESYYFNGNTPEAIILSCFDSVRREVARLSLHKLVTDGRIHPARIEEVVKKTRKQIDEEIIDIGKRTVIDLGIHGLHPELIKTVGRMKYRSSYGQNLLQHSREVAKLCGTMAAELGLNPKLAKRAGLLHDIGKVPETETEVPHAILGMQWAEKYGEKEEVCNAIGAHHDEVEMTSLLSPIIQVCDAISGARPGARRQVLDSYIQRLKDLEDIAFGFGGVKKAYAIQAGRELRVIVESEKVSDDKANNLSFEISQKIQTDMTYPGQVKVTVIRETRAVNIAK